MRFFSFLLWMSVLLLPGLSQAQKQEDFIFQLRTVHENQQKDFLSSYFYSLSEKQPKLPVAVREAIQSLPLQADQAYWSAAEEKTSQKKFYYLHQSIEGDESVLVYLFKSWMYDESGTLLYALSALPEAPPAIVAAVERLQKAYFANNAGDGQPFLYQLDKPEGEVQYLVEFADYLLREKDIPRKGEEEIYNSALRSVLLNAQGEILKQGWLFGPSSTETGEMMHTVPLLGGE